jgi:hypothetical protein
VGDKQQTAATLSDQLNEDLENGAAGLRVQISGWLVGKDEARPVYDGASDGNPLHLTSGKFSWVSPRKSGEIDPLQHGCHYAATVTAPLKQQR